MNVDSTLKALLDKLGVPVARLKYNGRAACFITYQLVVGRDTLFSDDISIHAPREGGDSKDAQFYLRIFDK